MLGLVLKLAKPTRLIDSPDNALLLTNLSTVLHTQKRMLLVWVTLFAHLLSSVFRIVSPKVQTHHTTITCEREITIFEIY